MKYLDKIFDYFRIMYRLEYSHGMRIFKQDNCYWLCDGYVAAKVGTNLMELNPTLFKDVDLTDLLSKDHGSPLENLNLQEKNRINILVPFKGDGFTIWFNKKFLDLFPDVREIRATGPHSPAYVYVDGDPDAVGVILPVRHPKELPNLFTAVA